MKRNADNYFIAKILLLGLISAALVYLFHPSGGQFSIIINGEPVTNPIIQLAAFPSLLIVLFFTAILTIIAFMGAGLFIFLTILIFVLFGIFMFSPYTWPVLAVIFITIIIMSLGSNKNN